MTTVEEIAKTGEMKEMYSLIIILVTSKKEITTKNGFFVKKT
jgi:hypothetical protein